VTSLGQRARRSLWDPAGPAAVPPTLLAGLVAASPVGGSAVGVAAPGGCPPSTPAA